MTKSVKLGFLLALACMFGCSTPQKLILGKWQQVGKNRTLQFFPDGTLTALGSDGQVTGMYSLPDDHHLKLQIPPSARIEVCEFTVTRRALVVIVEPNEDVPVGTTITLNRIE